MDRLGFWGAIALIASLAAFQFQYPLMDRLGFWGDGLYIEAGRLRYFSIR